MDLTNGDIGVGEEAVEFLHQVLAHEVTPANLVQWVGQKWGEDVLKIISEISISKLSFLAQQTKILI